MVFIAINTLCYPFSASIEIVGFSKKQDIQIGDKKIDSQFIIQGYHKDDVILLLSDSKVRNAIHDLKKKVAGQPILKGNFRISDSKVTYSEGPYDHPIKFINTVFIKIFHR